MGIVQSGWKKQIKGLKLFEILESRKKIKIETYEKLHKNQILNPLTSDINVVKLSKIVSIFLKLIANGVSGLRDLVLRNVKEEAAPKTGVKL